MVKDLGHYFLPKLGINFLKGLGLRINSQGRKKGGLIIVLGQLGVLEGTKKTPIGQGLGYFIQKAKEPLKSQGTH